MKEPVIAADGHTYKKAAILDWLQLHAESPVSGESLSDHTVLPNIVMHGLLTDNEWLSLISEWSQKPLMCQLQWCVPLAGSTCYPKKGGEARLAARRLSNETAAAPMCKLFNQSNWLHQHCLFWRCMQMFDRWWQEFFCTLSAIQRRLTIASAVTNQTDVIKENLHAVFVVTSTNSNSQTQYALQRRRRRRILQESPGAKQVYVMRNA